MTQWTIFQTIRRLPAIAVFALLMGTSIGGAADRGKVTAFLEVTGFDVALDSIALGASDAPAMLGMSTSDFGHDWKRVADEVFDTSEMREIALEILGQTLTDDLLNHAAAFYATSLGQRLVEVENASHMVEDDEAKREEGEALVAKGVSAGSERIGILRELNSAVGGADGSVRAVQEIQVRFLMAASNAGVLEQELDEAMLRAVLKEGEAELRLSMQRAGLAGAAYTYQTLSDDDLRAYVAALNHPKMQVVYELMNAVQYEVMANRFEVLAARMADLHPGQEL